MQSKNKTKKKNIEKALISTHVYIHVHIYYHYNVALCSNRKKRINELYYLTEKKQRVACDFVVCDSSDRIMPMTSAFSEACSAVGLLSSCILYHCLNCFDVNYVITSRWLGAFTYVFTIYLFVWTHLSVSDDAHTSNRI